QKAAMEALAELKEAGFALPPNAAIYFATQFGEVDATLAVAESILAKALPVSPTAFQHSVHNAVPGYVSIACEARNPSLTVSSGFRSFDKLLFWSFHELRSGLLDAALVINANERLAERSPLAESEMLLLAANSDATNTALPTELTAVNRASSRTAYDF